VFFFLSAEMLIFCTGTNKAVVVLIQGRRVKIFCDTQMQMHLEV